MLKSDLHIDERAHPIRSIKRVKLEADGSAITITRQYDTYEQEDELIREAVDEHLQTETNKPIKCLLLSTDNTPSDTEDDSHLHQDISQFQSSLFALCEQHEIFCATADIANTQLSDILDDTITCIIVTGTLDVSPGSTEQLLHNLISLGVWLEHHPVMLIVVGLALSMVSSALPGCEWNLSRLQPASTSFLQCVYNRQHSLHGLMQGLADWPIMYGVKGCRLIEGVKKEDQLYTLTSSSTNALPINPDSSLCSIALGMHGNSHIAYVADAKGGESSMEIMKRLIALSCPASASTHFPTFNTPSINASRSVSPSQSSHWSQSPTQMIEGESVEENERKGQGGRQRQTLFSNQHRRKRRVQKRRRGTSDFHLSLPADGFQFDTQGYDPYGW